MRRVRHRIMRVVPHRVRFWREPRWNKRQSWPLLREVVGKVLELTLDEASVHLRHDIVVWHVDLHIFVFILHHVPLPFIGITQAFVVIVVVVAAVFALHSLCLHLLYFGSDNLVRQEIVSRLDLFDFEVVRWWV